MSRPFLFDLTDPFSMQPSLPNTVQTLNLSLDPVCHDDSRSGLLSDPSKLVLWYKDGWKMMLDKNNAWSTTALWWWFLPVWVGVSVRQASSAEVIYWAVNIPRRPMFTCWPEPSDAPWSIRGTSTSADLTSSFPESGSSGEVFLWKATFQSTKLSWSGPLLYPVLSRTSPALQKTQLLDVLLRQSRW